MSYVIPLMGLPEACAWFPPVFAPCTFFSFAGFALDPFTVISPSYEYYYMLSSRSLPSKH